MTPEPEGTIVTCVECKQVLTQGRCTNELCGGFVPPEPEPATQTGATCEECQAHCGDIMHGSVVPCSYHASVDALLEALRPLVSQLEARLGYAKRQQSVNTDVDDALLQKARAAISAATEGQPDAVQEGEHVS